LNDLSRIHRKEKDKEIEIEGVGDVIYN